MGPKKDERIPKGTVDSKPDGFEESPTGSTYIRREPPKAISDDLAKVLGFALLGLLSGGGGSQVFSWATSAPKDECVTEAEMASYKADVDDRIETIGDDVRELHDLFNSVFEVKVQPRGTP